MLQLPDQWLWDSWVADDGQRYHLFFLQAPRSLTDPAKRHTHAVIGHASSVDLVEWTYHGVALAPDPGGWDDLALWTGCTLQGNDGRWRMFYTAINTRGHGVNDQRIGLAISDDLHTWQRAADKPIVQVDPRWYKTLANDPGASETWRDPYVFADPTGDGWRMLICARDRHASPKDDGVLAQARSADLVDWEIGPPLTKSGTGFGQLEVPQVHEVDDIPVLLFSSHPEGQTQDRIDTVGSFCTWSVTGSSTAGRWDVGQAKPFTAEPALFAAPLVHRRDGSWVLLGFRNLESEACEALFITDPIPVRLDEHGLVVAPPL